MTCNTICVSHPTTKRGGCEVCKAYHVGLWLTLEKAVQIHKCMLEFFGKKKNQLTAVYLNQGSIGFGKVFSTLESAAFIFRLLRLVL